MAAVVAATRSALPPPAAQEQQIAHPAHLGRASPPRPSRQAVRRLTPASGGTTAAQPRLTFTLEICSDSLILLDREKVPREIKIFTLRRPVPTEAPSSARPRQTHYRRARPALGGSCYILRSPPWSLAEHNEHNLAVT